MARGSKPRILYLEDDERWIDAVQGYLEDLYEIISTASPLEAFDMVEVDSPHDSSRFDLLIVDISLVLADPSDEQGMTFIKNLRNIEKTNQEAGEPIGQTKIIILTGYPWTERYRRAFHDYHVSDFIDKAKSSRKP